MFWSKPISKRVKIEGAKVRFGYHDLVSKPVFLCMPSGNRGCTGHRSNPGLCILYSFLKKAKIRGCLALGKDSVREEGNRLWDNSECQLNMQCIVFKT